MSTKEYGEMGTRLREWRKHVLGMTQEQFAQATGIHLSAIRKYENRLSLPSGESLLAIASTGVNLHWLLTSEGDTRAPSERSVRSSQLSPKDELAKGMAAIEGLLSCLDPERMRAVLNEIFSRVQEAKRVADLEKFVIALERKVG